MGAHPRSASSLPRELVGVPALSCEPPGTSLQPLDDQLAFAGHRPRLEHRDANGACKRAVAVVEGDADRRLNLDMVAMADRIAVVSDLADSFEHRASGGQGARREERKRLCVQEAGDVLVAHAGKVVAKERLMNQLFNFDESVSINALELHISRLRKKLEHANVEIGTVRGVGYVVRVSE